MKHFELRILPFLLVAATAVVAVACDDDSQTTWEEYAEWREANVAFYEEQQYMMSPSGENEYSTLTAQWNTNAQVLIKYLTDRALTQGNLSPLLTSTVKVKYIGRLYNGTAFDSSYLNTDSLYETGLTSVISGWTIALQDMRVGDSARVVIPYSQGYGSSGSGSIPPYSTLVFDIKLVDIPYYEVRP